MVIDILQIYQSVFSVILCLFCRLYHHKTAEPSTGLFAAISNMVSSSRHTLKL